MSDISSADHINRSDANQYATSGFRFLLDVHKFKKKLVSRELDFIH